MKVQDCPWKEKQRFEAFLVDREDVGTEAGEGGGGEGGSVSRLEARRRFYAEPP